MFKILKRMECVQKAFIVTPPLDEKNCPPFCRVVLSVDSFNYSCLITNWVDLGGFRPSAVQRDINSGML